MTEAPASDTTTFEASAPAAVEQLGRELIVFARRRAVADCDQLDMMFTRQFRQGRQGFIPARCGSCG
jgi:hypothetical protein